MTKKEGTKRRSQQKNLKAMRKAQKEKAKTYKLQDYKLPNFLERFYRNQTP